ncbi:MAG: peptide deformylase [Deltaproteobacteria bacterium]|nr:peptide deformylase [Deltaproteobacteria bacterium]
MEEFDREDLLEIVRLGHPSLRTIADPVPTAVLGTPEFRRFADQLIYTMIHAEGVGLASPQVAEPLRCFAYFVPGDGEDNEVQPCVIVNPEIRSIGSEGEFGWEGCLSIPELRGIVPRFGKIEVEGLDIEGNPLSFIAEGFHARVIQHEFDHLDGVIFLDRMEDMSSLAYEEEWLDYVIAPEGEDDDEWEEDE